MLIEFLLEIEIFNFQSKLKISIAKKNSISISVFVVKIKKNIQSKCQKDALKKNMLIYY